MENAQWLKYTLTGLAGAIVAITTTVATQGERIVAVETHIKSIDATLKRIETSINNFEQ